MKILTLLLILALPYLKIYPEVGEKAPSNYYLMSYNNFKPISFSELISNKKVVLNFWSIYCKPCKKEIPEILKLLERNEKISLYFVNFDNSKKQKEIYKKIEELKIQNYSLLDKYQICVRSFMPNEIVTPTTIILNEEGEIIFKSSGYTKKSLKEFKNFINNL